ncbi:MAG: hypothetical protein IJX58_04505 [Clostridia bacterium]|nr:hypothetical protein [Clostridia bacterium]
MSSKINMSFFKAYIELDKVCADRLGVEKNGVSAYINSLVELRFAPERSEVLPRLIKYRKARNIIAHEDGAIDQLDELTKDDIKWLNRFAKSVSHKRDPISRYERKARRYSIWKKVKIVLIILLVAAVAVCGYVVMNMLGII